jgi:HK97 family phage portal protein
MIRSGGVLVKTTGDLFTSASWNGIPQSGITQALRWGSYDEMYRRHLWVYVLVNKLAYATARLPLKVYRKGPDDSRDLATGDPYSELLKNPHPQTDPFYFWLWVASTLSVYGEAMLIKNRDRGGRPKNLTLAHPTRFRFEKNTWVYKNQQNQDFPIKRSDFVHFRSYDPTDRDRGLSPLEPLRWTLENEEGARRANSALWRNGARPSVVLKHPGNLSQGAQDRLAMSWAATQQGVDNFGKTAVLEEGMEAQMLTLNAEELQYIGTRSLNREEVCAAFDVPPPVVHILDRATFSNITEQMRSMYRDTMAPRLKLIESTLETELRDGRFGQNIDPDFPDNVYAEFLMDEVLRGDFETRAGAYQAGINSGWLEPSEVRKLENLPFIEGSDQLLVNSTIVPLESLDAQPAPALPAADPIPQLPAVAANAYENDPLIKRHIVGIRRRIAELNAGDEADA